jgi:hypothetical protein
VPCCEKIATKSPPEKGEGRQAWGGLWCTDGPTPALRATPPMEGISYLTCS